MTPEEIQTLIDKRIDLRGRRLFDEADVILEELRANHVLVEDISYKLGGGCTWSMVNTLSSNSDGSTIMEMIDNVDANTDLSLIIARLRENTEATFARDQEVSGRAHGDAAFSLALSGVKSAEIYAELVRGATSELNRCGHRVSTRMIDVLMIAEKFAAAGVNDDAFYRAAAAKMRAKLESAAAAGNEEDSSLEGAIERLESGSYGLMDDRPLLGLWRHAARQPKAGRQTSSSSSSLSFLSSSVFGAEEREGEGEKGEEGEGEDDSTTTPAASSPASSFYHAAVGESPHDLFSDPSLPLVVDLGCGYGVSMLGLCQQEQQQRTTDSRCFNYLGVDMSEKAVKYAAGVASRWGISDQCAFVVADALSSLEWVSAQYPGSVQWIICQFPSPPKWVLSVDNNASGGGNSQLPGIETFIINPGVVRLAGDILARKRGDIGSARKGVFLVQTQVEDVAVMVKRLVESTRSDNGDGGIKLRIPDSSLEVGSIGSNNSTQQQQQQQQQQAWVTAGELDERSATQAGRAGSRLRKYLDSLQQEDGEDDDRDHRDKNKLGNRACGRGFLLHNPLGHAGRTETEVMCVVESKPVHRVAWVVE
jgi:hypothetical protein